MHKVTKDAFNLMFFSAVAAIASFLFFFAMARLLPIEDYSLIYSMVALGYILSIPQETIRTVIARYVTKYKVKKEEGKIHELMSSSLKKISITSIIIFAIFIAISPLLTGLFHTSFLVVALSGTILIFAFIIPVIWGVYQGLGDFKSLGINNSIEYVIKLIIAVVLVLMLPIGIKIYGALIATPVSMLLAFLVGFFSFKDIRKKKKKKTSEKMTRYSIATLLIFGFVTLMYSVDVIIARYFFSSRISGIYAGISLISKSLFFIATATKRAMMPNVAEKNERRQEKECQKILKKVSIMIGIIFIAAFIISLLFPEIAVRIFLGKKFLAVVPYLKYMVIAIAFFSFANLLSYYNLSINRNKRITAQIFGSAAFLEIVLLILFHKDLMQFILMLIIVDVLLFLAMLIVTIIGPKHAKTLEEKEKQEKLKQKI